MRPSVICALAGALVVGHTSLHAQRKASPRPDLEGTWNSATLTPLQRPKGFEGKAAFTPEEAAEFRRTASDRARSKLPTEADRLTQADVDEAFVELEVFKLDGLRTSLIVDPPGGKLPALHVVERFTRVDSKTLRYRVTVDDPDTWATAWTAEWPFTATTTRIYSVECHEGNYAIENFLRGARAEERRQRH
jgi:hypothetical protein